MSMSDYERCRWAELAAELSREGRLAALDRRLDGAPSPAVIVCWAVGGGLGLALVLVGVVVHAAAVLATGTVVLSTTLALVGAALVAAGLRDMRRQRRGPRDHGRGEREYRTG